MGTLFTNHEYSTHTVKHRTSPTGPGLVSTSPHSSSNRTTTSPTALLPILEANLDADRGKHSTCTRPQRGGDRETHDPAGSGGRCTAVALPSFGRPSLCWLSFLVQHLEEGQGRATERKPDGVYINTGTKPASFSGY